MEDIRWPTYPPRNVVLQEAVLEGDAARRGALRVRDQQGRVYLDAINGIGCLPLGHAHPKWVSAIESQMRKLVAAAGTFWTQPQRDLAVMLSQRVPIRNARTFIANTGTESTEAAIKCALRATGRDVIIAFERAFHGRTLGSLALTAKAAYRAPYVASFEDDDSYAPFARINVARARFGDLEHVRELFDRYAGRVAMVVIEPVQGEGGVHIAPREFLLGLRTLCHERGALLGLDEVQAGSGRTGRFSAWSTIVGDDENEQPDILWFAKALGGGYPVAACVARQELADHMTKGTHGSTFGGNPLACAAALTTLRIFDEEGLLASAAQQLPTLERIAAADPEPRVAHVRGLGAMIGVDVGDADVATKLVGEIQREGVLVTLSGASTIRLLFPYRAGEAELREAWSALRRSLEKTPSPG